MDVNAFLQDIRTLIGQDNLREAVRQLQKLLKDSPLLDEAIHQSGRLANIYKHVRLGTISSEEAQLTQNQIRHGLLELVREIEDQQEIPAIREEVARAISIVGSKNVVAGSQIQAGGNVTIGDTTITESTTSRQLRYLSYLIIPVLAILLAVFGYRYWLSQKPFAFTVEVQNRTPNKELPFEQGEITLNYSGTPVEKVIRASEEVSFTGIPAKYWKKPVNLRFRAEGFLPIDTQLVLESESLSLPIRRDQSLSRLFGTVQDENQRPLAGVEIQVLDQVVQTGAGGRFELMIPLAQQRRQQRIVARKPGYAPWDFTVPVIPYESINIVLSEDE